MLLARRTIYAKVTAPTHVTQQFPPDRSSLTSLGQSSLLQQKQSREQPAPLLPAPQVFEITDCPNLLSDL